MALAQSFGTNLSNTVSQPTSSSQASQQQQPSLPRAELFDILPPLHELLARIEHSPTDAALAEDADATIDAVYADLQPLEPKDLPAEALAIKAKIRRALRELEKLPDMDRTLEEQNEEIAELEGRIARHKVVLRRLGAAASRMQDRLG